MNERTIDYSKTDTFDSYKETAAKHQRPPISEHYSDLQMQLQKLEEGIRELGSRLDPILTPQNTGGIEAEGQPNPSCSSLALSLYQDTQKVKELQSLINGLLRRVEI